MMIAGCDRIWQLDELGRPRADASVIDAEMFDAPPDARACFGSPQGIFQTCLTAPLDPPLSLSGVLDTTNDSRCRPVIQSTGEPACVIAAASFSITNALIVRGARPLVLIAGDAITVDALLDGSSTQLRSGAGSQGNGACGTNGNGESATNGGAGGAGGTFGYRGGAPQGGGSVATTAHASELIVPLLDVRGGCSGATGGLSTTAGGTKARGGTGGGALYLIAGSRIDVTANAVINASGAGGNAGPVSGGGGGGGAGGLIALDAPTIVVAGQLFARGGGGGSGGSDTTSGNRGAEPADAIGGTNGGSPASTGSGSGPGWPGCGGPNGTDGGNNAGGTATAGGGGGGGACGYIFIYAETTTLSAMTSPIVMP
jgi:hypothetical protein